MASTEQDQMMLAAQKGRMTEEEARRVSKLRRCPSTTPTDCVQLFDDTADKYEEVNEILGYNAPQYAAKATMELYPSPSHREKVRILDVAAGTGLAGVELHKLGFRQLEALDPSQGMLDVAATKGVYSRLMNEFMTDKQLPMEDNWYDAIVIAGSIGLENYIPLSAWDEMIRLVAPGGFIVNVMRTEYLPSDFGGRLTKLMEELQRDGRLRQMVRRIISDYARDVEGVVFVYQVL